MLEAVPQPVKQLLGYVEVDIGNSRAGDLGSL